MDIELFERALTRVMEDRKSGSLDETALRAVMDALTAPWAVGDSGSRKRQ